LKTLFVHHSSPHHAINSGYNTILDYYPSSELVTGKSSVPYKIIKLISKLHSQKSGLYNSDSVQKDLELYFKLKQNINKDKIVHYLNGERDIRHIVNNKKRFKRTCFTATFHKPPAILDWRVVNPRYVCQLNGAVAVGENQVNYIKEKFKIENTVYIPHGINTNFFTPDRSQVKSNRLLFVGQHLRDFDALNYCVPRIAEKIKDLTVHVVLHKAYQKKINPHKAIKVFSNLSDRELKQQYQEASLLLLPMLNSTACNSILEALASGLPIITTSVGGNSKYLEATESTLVPASDFSALIEETIALLKDTSKQQKLSQLARAKATTYDWSIIAQQLQDFHSTLLKKIS